MVSIRTTTPFKTHPTGEYSPFLATNEYLVSGCQRGLAVHLFVLYPTGFCRQRAGLNNEGELIRSIDQDACASLAGFF